ncbi:hypothetical protein CAPTEDRAFT_207499, partial [Capitella teleta]
MMLNDGPEEVDDESIHRLEGSMTGGGGLVIMKKGLDKGSNSEPHTFKRPVMPSTSPSGSLLGLDKLAAAKRLKDEEEQSNKRSKVMSYTGEEEEVEEEESVRRHSEKNIKERHYRNAGDETPSHPGGVSDEFRRRDKDRRERGVHATSKEKKDRGRDSHRRRERHRRSDRDRGTRDWEQTPSSHSGEDELRTPKVHGK